MCGILAILANNEINKETLETLRTLISHRGPDYCSPLVEHRTKCGLSLKIIASVLHLRGKKIQLQPVIDDFGNILLFNGHIYGFEGAPLHDLELSDTSYLSEKLKSCDSREDVTQVLSAIAGPFAIAYWQEKSNSFFISKDVFGRKSLCLLRGPDFKPLAISSIGSPKLELFNEPDLSWVELDSDKIYCFDFNEPNKSNLTTFCLNRPSDIRLQNDSASSGFFKFCPLNYDMRHHKDFSREEKHNALDILEKKLVESISKRIRFNREDCLKCRSQINPEKCAHSKVLVAFSGGIDSTLVALILDRVVAEGETIDLTTVAFKPDSPDRESVASAFSELRNLCPKRNWRLILSDVPAKSLQTERCSIIQHLILPRNTVIDDSLGCACWFIGQAKGRALDSSISHEEFQSLFNTFIQFNTEAASEFTNCGKIKLQYESPATMLFCGSGIDEQLGGYSSHKAAWTKSGSEGVCREIERQMLQLPFRNLGRDDRVYSDHGRDVKLPYLDYELVAFLNQLPVGLKMDLDATPDIGPKKLLRDLAHRLGLKVTCRRVKRALQFGTRIANLEGTKEKGNDICDRLS